MTGKVRVRLIDADQKEKEKGFPNLALMKISSYYKTEGAEVGFNVADPNLVYISVVFEENLEQARGIATYYPEAEVFLGGPALEIPNTLPPEIEKCMPDYELYGSDYSMGFTTRGCIRKCPFCIVHKVEPEFKYHKHPRVFHHPDHKKIVFLDNNFLACSNRLETIQYILDHDIKACFNQGLDARLIDEEVAVKLASMKLYNLHFTFRTIYVAWDLMDSQDGVLKGIQNLIDAGVNPNNIKVYVLTLFNTTFEEDKYRVEKLLKMGVEPYIMRYNGDKSSKDVNQLARWCARHLYRVCKFEDYDPRNHR